MSRKDTGSQAEASSQISAGVSSGASRVVTAAIATARARSPLASQAMTLDEVPLGQQPTRITPTAISAGSWNNWHNSQATPGMIMKCATTPRATRQGWRATAAKSSSLRVRPMPNMTRPSSGTMALLRPMNHCGCKKARMANNSTHQAKVLPTKRLRAARVRMAQVLLITTAARSIAGKASSHRFGVHRSIVGAGFAGDEAGKVATILRSPAGFLLLPTPRTAPAGTRQRSASSG
ncbi:hypothetical protein D3C80_1205530 [compost metagenome]